MVKNVAPLVGAWIEIVRKGKNGEVEVVAPLVGAWIEIGRNHRKSGQHKVAPLVGAWIEITKLAKAGFADAGSLPSWERGLKSE